MCVLTWCDACYQLLMRMCPRPASGIAPFIAGLRGLENQHAAEMATLRKEHTSLLGQIENYHRELEQVRQL